AHGRSRHAPVIGCVVARGRAGIRGGNVIGQGGSKGCAAIIFELPEQRIDGRERSPDLIAVCAVSNPGHPGAIADQVEGARDINCSIQIVSGSAGSSALEVAGNDCVLESQGAAIDENSTTGAGIVAV